MLNIEQQVVKQIAMNNINKILLAIIILLQNTVSAQVNDCVMVTNIKDCYNAYNDCITFNVTNKCDSTIKCIIRVQEYRYADSSWFESWSDIYLKKITVCKPGSPIVTIPVDSSIERQWCPIDCIDYFGRKWVEEKIRGQEENKVRLCRFAFYIFQVDKWKEEKKPFYCSEPFRVIITQ